MAKFAGRAFVVVAVTLLVAGSVSQSKEAGTGAVADFDVEGVGFTMCQCTAYACPCRSNGHPDHGSCNAADFVYIRRGHYGNVKLDGLKVVEVGDLIDVNPDKTGATLYFDEKTTPAQREAFTAMYKFMFGWAPVKLQKIQIVPIEFTESADKTQYAVNIPGILEEKAVMKRDKSGKPVSTLPAMDQWGNTIHYVDNIVFKYHDRELNKEWDLSGRQSNVKYFHTTKAMLRQEGIARSERRHVRHLDRKAKGHPSKDGYETRVAPLHKQNTVSVR